MNTGLQHSEQEHDADSAEMKFYVVSQQKLLIMFLGTFGMYVVYWFYRHWSEYKQSAQADLWPIMRGIFTIFFTHSLFSLFEEKYEKKTGEAPKSINHLATIYVVFAVGCQIMQNLSDRGYGNPITLYLSLLVLPVSCWVLYTAQSLANYSGNDVLGKSNNTLSSVNYFWLFLGAILWILVLLGIYVKAVG